MRVHTPKPAGDARQPEMHVVTVVNPGQVELLNQEKPRLLQTIRQALGNDYFDFRIDVDESAVAPTAWSDRDVLTHMVNQSEHFARLIRDMKFMLS
jgi:quinol monooxygenase YgiN